MHMHITIHNIHIQYLEKGCQYEHPPFRYAHLLCPKSATILDLLYMTLRFS